MIFKNFADQDWIGFNFFGSGLNSDRKYHSALISAAHTLLWQNRRQKIFNREALNFCKGVWHYKN